jgi:putative cardiolipin synthase
LAQRLAAGTDGFFWGTAHVLVDDPAKVTRATDDTQGHLLPQLHQLGLPMRTELLIVSPYFVPGDAGVAWLRGLVQSGARVTVLTNSLAASDVGAVHAGYKKYRLALLEAGVRLYEIRPEAIEYARGKDKNRQIGGSRASLHAKTFVYDRRAVFVGSLNLDPRSVQLNTEIGVVCDSEPFATALVGGVEGSLDKVAWRLERKVEPGGKPHLVWIETTAEGTRRRSEEPGVSAWRQIGVWFLGLLPIESQL